MFLSCGWFGNDGISFEEKIVGKFVIIQDRSDTNKNFNLAFKNSDGVSSIYSGIADNCKKVIYDSISKKIYVQENDDNPNFKEIIIIDLKTDNFVKSKKIKNITKEKFESTLSNCENCIIKNY